MAEKSTAKGKRIRNIVYWAITLFLCFELIHGALWDFNILNAGYVYGVLDHLGYPHYLGAILGVSKIAAAIVFLSPGLLLLKEWAYSGIVILFMAAFLSHVITGDGVGVFIWSFLFGIFTILSWTLRPANRRLD